MSGAAYGVGRGGLGRWLSWAGSTLARRLLGGAAAGFGTRVGRAVCSIGSAAVLARILEPTSFGLFFLGQTTALFGGVVAALGLENTVVREVAALVAGDDEGAIGGTLRRARGLVLVGIVAVGGLLVFARDLVLLDLFGGPELAASAGWLAAWLAFEALNRLHVSALRGEHRLAAAATLDGFLQGLLFLVAVAGMAVVGGVSLERVFLAAALCSGASAAVGWALLAGTSRGSAHPGGAPSSDARGPSAGDLWNRSWPLLGATSLGFLIAQGDLWLVGIVGSGESAALYGSVLRLIFLVSLPLFVLNRTLSSTLAEFHARGMTRELEALLRGGTTLTTAVTGLVALGLLLFGEQVLSLVFGDFYAAAQPVLVVLVLGRVVLAATGPCGTMLMMAGHERLQLTVSAASGAYLILGSLWAGGRWGVLGVAVVVASNTVLNNLVTLALVRWKVGVWSHTYLNPVRGRERLDRLMQIAARYST